ncbi:MAG: BTAD domain-containing putative transcriptional regulator [Acetobacteraceae bacterium]|jgi:DNA-binding SARP family transcriptional activator
MFRPAHTRPSIQLSLLGGFRLRVEGRDVGSLPRKARALLAYLAVQDGKPVSREAMADLLWTDRGAEQARHSLRQTLLVLRRELGPVADTIIRSDDHALAFLPTSVDVDVDRARSLADSSSLDDLTEAAGLFERPCLDRLPGIAAEFDDWLGRFRAQMSESASDVLARLVEAHLAAGNTVDAVRAAERMLTLDPLREDVHRRLMSIYARAGRRSDAVRQYNACIEMLRRELNVGPSPETEALLQSLRDGGRGTSEPYALSGARSHNTPYAQPAEGAPWIAVLPFRAIGPDPVPGYFATGLVEDIVCTLATLREPVVISANSTLVYQGQPIDLRSVGRELGVRYVVSGSIRRLGPSLRMVVELADAETRAVRWAETYDATERVLFDAQDSAVARIVNTLVPRLGAAELQRIRGKHADSLTAYDLVLQARELMFQLTRDASDRAGTLLRRAVEISPDYSAAHAAIAAWESLRVGQGWSDDPRRAAVLLDAAARDAIRLDAHNSQALALLGHSRTVMSREYAEAQALFEHALQAAPNDAAAWTWSSPTSAYLGDGADAVTRAETALRLSPRDPFAFRIHCFLSLAHYTNGSFEEAAHWGQISVQENPRYTAGLRAAAASLVAIGRKLEAREIGNSIRVMEPSFRADPARLLWCDQERREQYSQHLIEAGLPR